MCTYSIWRRGVTRTIEGSAGTVLVSVSPDGQWVLLTRSVSIERVSMFAGTPLPVVNTEEGTPRADWGPGNWIVYENLQAIWKASTETNEAMPFTVKDMTAGEVDHDWPRLLPDGRTVMATIEYGNKPSVIGFWDFDTGERKGQVPLPGYRARYVSSGHLMLVLGAASGNLVALPFDLRTLSPTGPPVPVLANVSTLIATSSDGGTLVTGGEQGTELRSARETPLAVGHVPFRCTSSGLRTRYLRGFRDQSRREEGRRRNLDRRHSPIREKAALPGIWMSGCWIWSAGPKSS